MPTNTAPAFIAGHTGATDLRQPTPSVEFLTVQPNGRLLGLGPHGLVQLNPDGSLYSQVEFGPTLDLSLLTGGAPHYLFGEGYKMLPDGKAVVGGSWYTNGSPDKSGFLLYRINADHTLDKTFAKGQGWVNANPGEHDRAAGMLALPDGKFLVVGTSSASSSPDQPNNFIAMSRFTARGDVDLSFGNQGSIKIPDDNVKLNQVLLQSDGKILAAGSHNAGGYAYTPVVYRFNADGTLDTSFGNGGNCTFSYPSSAASVSAMAIQPDGKIVTVSATSVARLSSETSFGVTRINPDGTLDTTFGNGGKVILSPLAPFSPAPSGNGNFYEHHAGSIIVRQDGSIVIGGSIDQWIGYRQTGSQFAMLALRPNGTLDSSFGTNGSVLAPQLDTRSTTPLGLLETPDGQLRLSGYLTGGNYPYIMYGFNADGTPDQTFGTVAPGSRNAMDYMEGRAAAALNPGIELHDKELAAATYLGAVLQLQRQGGANESDVFEATGKLSFVDGNAVIAGIVIGKVTTGAGTLRIDFNADATEALVNQALHGIAYRNTAELAEHAKVIIDWNFNDGGNGGEPSLGAKASTEVQLIASTLPSWIAQFIHARDPAALREQLRAYLGPDQVQSFSFPSSDNATALSQADQELVEGLLKNVATVSGIKWNKQSTPGSAGLEIHYSGELPAGKTAYTAWGSNGADLYIGKTASASIRGMLPELNKNLMHVLGLVGDTTLSSNLDALHIAALQYLYGPSTAIRQDNDTYKLSETTSQMLWDGAGIDTIDGSGLSKDLTLHLEAGHWDYVGGKGASITSAGQITVNYGSTFENAYGGSGNDKLFGTAGNNVLRGGAGNDLITGNGGDDTIDGGAGLDTVNFAGKRADHSITATANGFSVGSSTGLASVTGVERLHFADGDKALDIDGKAGQLFRLYQAIFNRKPDEAGLGYWLKAVDNGTTMESVALEFTKSAEFAKMYGVNVSNKEMLTKIYEYAL
ncbi:DUF4214 domain-containing protein, partial [Pseudoduganella sp.]|uniref:DUF4214 domain-containing protein n=1 Tax=Pseudoduganella sp. TaxID=1880898 RepID=UPI0035B08736